MISNIDDFLESEHCDNSEYTENPIELIIQNIVTPKVAFEYYVSTQNLLSESVLTDFFDVFKLDINAQYNLPTDSNKSTTLLNSLCEYRRFRDIQLVLKLGANPNVKDTIGYTPFQSLLSGHSYGDIGTNVDNVKETIKTLLEYGTLPTLENWQFEEHYKPYIEQDDFFEKIASMIHITQNTENDENTIEKTENQFDLISGVDSKYIKWMIDEGYVKDDGVWRRIPVIPFKSTFVEENNVKNK